MNDNDLGGDTYATVLKLAGTAKNPLLKAVAPLDSQEPSVHQLPFAPTVQVVRDGTGVCLFMADSAGPESDTPNEISSFKYPGLAEVGSYSNSNVSSSELGIVIAAQGNYLFAAYNGYQTQNYVAT